MALDKITNWPWRATQWLYYQFRAKPKMRALVEGVIGPQIQDLEDILQVILANRILTSASGFGLDVWGELFGVPRSGRTDAAYRSAIELAAARDRNSGTAEQIIEITGTLTSAARVYLDEYKTRAIRLYFRGATISNDRAAELVADADGLAAGGVKVDKLSLQPAGDYFGWSGDPDSGGWGTVEDTATGGAWTKLL